MTAFSPAHPSVSISVTSTGVLTALPVQPSNAPIQICLTNTASADAFFALGTSTATCTTTNGRPLLARSVEAFTVQPGQTHIFLITAASQTATVFVTPGVGE